MVPRSTSAATAAEPRTMLQIETRIRKKGWFQNAIMISAEVGSFVIPRRRIQSNAVPAAARSRAS